MKLKQAVVLLTLVLSPIQISAHGGAEHIADKKIVKVGLGSATPASLYKKILLNTNYGNAYFFEKPVNQEEMYINQGYASLNVFHFVDAFRSFKMALEENHESIYALTGLVFSVLEQDTQRLAVTLCTKYLNQIDSIKRSRILSAKELAWAEMAKSLFSFKAHNVNNLADAVIFPINDSYAALAAVDGENPEFKSYLHWSLMQYMDRMISESSIRSVLKKYPNHAGANNYLLLLAEKSKNKALAESYGKVLIESAPKSASAQHMYGHVLLSKGDWFSALRQFVVADEVLKNWSEVNGIPVQEDWHYTHNLRALATAYMGIDETRSALAILTKIAKNDKTIVPEAMGLSVVIGEPIAAELVLKSPELIEPLQQEVDFHRSGAIPNIFQKNEFGKLTALIYKSYLGNVKETMVADKLNQYFRKRFIAGGGKGFKATYVELLRARKIAKKANLGNIHGKLYEIQQDVKSGKLF